MARPSTEHTLVFPDIAAWKNNPRLVSGRSNKNLAPSQIIPPGNQGIPLPVSNLSVSSQSTSEGIKITTSHVVNPQDTAHSHVDIWATGYLGNTNPIKVSSGTSPHTFILPATGENVSLHIQSVGKDGSPLPIVHSPSRSITLK